jgi:murein L,D-transpeptidase YafK
MEIRISKSRKILQLIDDGNTTNYPIGIGKDETPGPKLSRGDHRTPVGEYRVCVKNPKSKFHLSLGLNYPNRDDAERGLSAGVISRDEHTSILRRLESGDGSDWKTPMGGEIYIHGDLDTKAWSEGCVRMYNADIEKIYPLIDVGTRVVIED